MLVAPYLDAVVVDDYLKGMRKRVPVRMLTSNKRLDYTARLVAASVTQEHNTVCTLRSARTTNFTTGSFSSMQRPSA